MLDHPGPSGNYVWSGNKSHIKFLKLLGAKFHDDWTVSPVTGERFQLFTISKEDACEPVSIGMGLMAVAGPLCPHPSKPRPGCCYRCPEPTGSGDD
ncbi:hypothetical protein [Enterobacter phage 04_vB_Eclo_IJM]|nr:hypothetical protein [Enterobacter phage 04_vB_Eclo_IJM]